MAFPPRPPNVMQIPGMPPVPPMMPPHYGMPGMPGMIPVTMSMGMMPGPVSIMMGPVMAMPPSIISAPKPHIKKQPQLSTEYLSLQSETSKGPPVTVFVGNITERASDSMIRQMLQRCGTVINWKRVQAFGFCEYGDPESGLRAIRLLHDWEVGDKKLVVKVDAKTKEKLDEYKATKKASHGSGKKTADEDNDLDDMTRDFDMSAKASIQYLLHEHSMELSRPTLEQKAAAANNSDKAKKMTKTQENLMKMSSDLDKDSKNNLDEMDLEDDKRNLIHREIDKFRDTYKA